MATKPKRYFYGSGLAVYLTKWRNRDTRMNGVMGGAIFENFAVSEIVKSYLNCGLDPLFTATMTRTPRKLNPAGG